MAHIHSSSMTKIFYNIFHVWFYPTCYRLAYTMLYLYTFRYMLSHTIIIDFLYTFAILHNLFCQTWYMHPWLYNSANSVPSAENSILQTVKNTFLVFQSPTEMPPTPKHLSPHNLRVLSVSLVAMVYIFWYIGMCTGIHFSLPIKLWRILIRICLIHFQIFLKPNQNF